MRQTTFLCVLSVFVMARGAAPAEWYVGPTGGPKNPGTREKPWDIESALGGQQKIAEGDTIWLLGGTYRRRPKEQFDIRLLGAKDKPVVVRPAPGARATIDGGLAMQAPSEHVWVRDLEILVSEPHPTKPVGPGSHPQGFKRPWGGLNLFGGTKCRYINLVIHDCRQGISAWKNEIDCEIYGCIVYGNGWPATDRGHGHCIYTQNEKGTKTISNCILACRYRGTYTMHAYGSRRAYVDNFLLTENIAYDLGPFLVGGGRPSRGIRVLRNYLHGVSLRVGYNAPHNEDCTVSDNVVVDGQIAITRYRKAVQEGNLVVKRGAVRPVGHKAVLLPNKYEPNRAHLAVWNWQKAPSVDVPAAPFLKPGEPFRLMDPKNLFGKPLAEGVCRGTSIPVSTHGEFSAFVVLKGKPQARRR